MLLIDQEPFGTLERYFLLNVLEMSVEYRFEIGASSYYFQAFKRLVEFVGR